MAEGFERRKTLGRTGLSVGPLGVACGYGAPREAYEEAFDHGVNYFYWGSRRTWPMAEAVGGLVRGGRRDDLVLVMQSYSRSAKLLRGWFERGLRKIGLEYADVLLLGWHNKLPSERILDEAMAMKERGLFRFLALSGHHRPLFPDLAGDPRFDVLHVRYNAVHRGAEEDVFARLPAENRPGVVTYTATRWGDLLKTKKMPDGEQPLSGADCYRFVMSNPAVDVCMTGPSNLEHMREALRALDLGPLSEDEVARIRRIGDHIHVHHKKVFAN